MSSSRKRLESLCAEVGNEDGTDPRDFFRKKPRTKTDRKALQLCKQVEQTLSYVLSGELDDPVLRDLMIMSVEPAPDSSRLLVTLAPFGNETTDAGEAVARLAAVSGNLRAAISQAINRKRTPELSFHVMPTASEDGA